MALNIEVTEDYRITSDNMNIIVNERYLADPTKAPNWKKREAEGASPEPVEKWREISYHSTVESAMNKIVDKTILDSDAQTISELLREIREIRREISDVLAK